jgi:hypothetical protein
MDLLLHHLLKPDNLPLAIMVPAMIMLFALWWRVARRNDRLLREGGVEAVKAAMDGPHPSAAGEAGQARSSSGTDRVHTWPYLVRIEFLAALVVILLLTIWSVAIDAPLEQVADPSRTPNPSKAPWYFVGLQELLVYFDPWFAGVALPLLIIVGLCLIPYLDPNPDSSGYYSWRGRRLAIATFLFGFVVLWFLPILIGVFCRGPGWNWFWPWESWDANNTAIEQMRNWSDVFGISSESGAMAFGGLSILLFYGTAFVHWRWRRHSPTLATLGGLRYSILAFLYLTMLAVPLKIALRLGLSVKYVWVTPWFNV